MAMKQKGIFINCAVTGSIHIPTMSEYLPITPGQIGLEAEKAAKAGAATVHHQDVKEISSMHDRSPREGKERESDTQLRKKRKVKGMPFGAIARGEVILTGECNFSEIWL